ncbi:rRNA methyltransferase [Candidatus Pacearchaeota archaeon]|nr:rRNA methyltransferase [Candidatus Pacearchaeota archaeon]
MTWNKINRIDSTDSNVAKYVFANDTAVAEAVLYKYPTYEDRTVICCSTQSGCPMGCRFCGAGDYFVRTLTSEEIVVQIEHLFVDKNIDPSKIKSLQIMFMSMGEPMLAWKQLKPALYELHGKYPHAALLISTSAPDVDDYFADLCRVSNEIPKIGLQFSVHESTDKARDELVPFKKKMNLRKMGLWGNTWAIHTSRRPFFNYCVHSENNTDEDIERLVDMFPPNVWESTLSVICERDEHIAAANQRQRSLVEDFMPRMLAEGYSVRMFDPAGQDDIGGGCGQLWFVQEWMRNNSECTRPSVGHDLPKVHTPCKL